jgi:hypothetical protein
MFEEIKEMIDSTIYTNGRGEVTAQNINLAMHGMVDATEEKFGEVNDAVKAVEDKVTALEENGTGGDVAYVYVPFGNQLSDVQIEENKKSYVKILNGADLKLNVSGAIGDAEFYRIESGAIIFDVIAHATAENSSGARIYHESLQCILLNDGTVIVDATDDNNTPAPSGPLRVWINEENTPEQVAENASTYTALKNNIAQQVCFVSTPIIDPDTLEAVVYTSYSVESIQRADSDNGFYLAKQFITDNDGTVGAINIAILLLEDGTLEYVS